MTMGLLKKISYTAAAAMMLVSVSPAASGRESQDPGDPVLGERRNTEHEHPGHAPGRDVGDCREMIIGKMAGAGAEENPSPAASIRRRPCRRALKRPTNIPPA